MPDFIGLYSAAEKGPAESLVEDGGFPHLLVHRSEAVKKSHSLRGLVR
jgi:hypothetical protein